MACYDGESAAKCAVIILAKVVIHRGGSTATAREGGELNVRSTACLGKVISNAIRSSTHCRDPI